MQDGAMFYKKLAVKPNVDIQKDFILCTIHRAENTDDETRLSNIFSALNEIAQEKTVILPLHPRTQKILEQHNINTKHLTLIDPVGYLEMVWLIEYCSLVMTDSGGLQKEAFFFAKPCMTLRDETEWVELVENRFNVLVGADKEKIISTYQSHQRLFATNYALDLYGGGQASKRIIQTLEKTL